jgi:hypothetical protein
MMIRNLTSILSACFSMSCQAQSSSTMSTYSTQRARTPGLVFLLTAKGRINGRRRALCVCRKRARRLRFDASEMTCIVTGSLGFSLGFSGGFRVLGFGPGSSPEVA